MVKTEQLKYFLDIAQSQSISRTAEHFYISQQAVSDAMKRLEQEFNCKFFRRKKNGVALTKEGEIFLTEARQMMASYTKMQVQLNPSFKENTLLKGQIRIMIHPRMYSFSFNEFITHFRLNYPDIKVFLIDGANQQTIASLGNNQVDIGTIYFGDETGVMIDEEEQNQFCLQSFYKSRVYICYSKVHPLYHEKAISLDKLKNFSMTSFFAREFMDTYLNDHLGEPANIYFCNDVAAQCELIRSGTAAGVLTEYEYKTLFKKDDQVVARLLENYTANFSLIYKVTAKNDPVLATVIAEVVNYYKKWG